MADDKFRPNANALRFATMVPEAIQEIRALARRSAGGDVSDYQIIVVCHKAGLVRWLNGVIPTTALLEDLNDASLFRIKAWLRACVFQQGYDDYFRRGVAGQ